MQIFHEGDGSFFTYLSFLFLPIAISMLKKNLKIESVREGRTSYGCKVLTLASRNLLVIINVI